MSKPTKQKTAKEELHSTMKEGAYSDNEIEIVAKVPRSKYDYTAIVNALKSGQKWLCSANVTKTKIQRVLSETRKLMPTYTIKKGVAAKNGVALNPTQYVLIAKLKNPKPASA